MLVDDRQTEDEQRDQLREWRRYFLGLDEEERDLEAIDRTQDIIVAGTQF